MLAGPNCRAAQLEKTDPLSVILSRLMVGSCRFFTGISEWVVLRVAFGRSTPHHALLAGLVLLRRSVLASAR